LPDDEAGQEPESGEALGPLRPFWSGTITFGLVSIPVSLFPANRESRIALRMLGPEGKPLARRYGSADTGRELSADEMVRGYEIEKGKYVVVSDEELDRLAPEKSRDIDLQRFVEAGAIPPMYFERSYFLTPAGGSTKAYRLLAATMEQTQRAGIATFVMRGKEYLVAILAENGILRAETLRFSDEIRSPEDVGLPAAAKIAPAEVRTFEKAIAKLSKDDISVDEMKDEASEKLMELAREKQAKHRDVIASSMPKKRGEVIDIMTALQRSLGQARQESASSSERKRPQSKRSGSKTTAARAPARKRKPARTSAK